MTVYEATEIVIDLANQNTLDDFQASQDGGALKVEACKQHRAIYILQRVQERRRLEFKGWLKWMKSKKRVTS